MFQNLISTLLKGIDGTDVSMDDILIYAETLNEITKKVVDRLKNAGLKLNPEKCLFAKKSVPFLGHVVSEEGLHPDSEKIEVIRRLKVPENKKQLQRLLGMRRGENVPIADALSPDVQTPTPENGEDLVVLNVSKVWMKEIVAKTDEHATLRELIKVIKVGWPNDPEKIYTVLETYWNYRDELSTYEELIFKGDRLLIPETFRSKTMNIIHAGHFGIQSSIKRAKQLVFWPSMGRDIERFVQQCNVCQKHSRNNVKEPMNVNKGLSARAVQIAKNILIKCYDDNSSVQLALLNYRNIPRDSKLLSPKQRLMSRITNSQLPAGNQKLKPAVIENVKHNLEAERFKQ
ncbi:uncharacterized protein K02A2.6-like [Ochlerotatus camptorhynchus]|uniref:uncharacterized protein K02A2.6-like n=1 Tax=Ochlerotatus camptorhynchus TaxID=644619 RepID=UPI0031D5E361